MYVDSVLGSTSSREIYPPRAEEIHPFSGGDLQAASSEKCLRFWLVNRDPYDGSIKRKKN